MNKYYTTQELINNAEHLKAGDEVYLSGLVYTARDAAHKKLIELMDNNQPLPFELKHSFIYYAGPTPTAPGKTCGSFGPTTSCRMDNFTPRLMDKGLFASIGKGGRSQSVKEAVVRNKGLYLLAIGGAGAIAAKHIESVTEFAFPELGCESIKQIIFNEFPLYVGIDVYGNSLV
ncbi:FumA C-terminus/TtdB family hydratase beta subunit [Eubacteriales bacterium OttesenSCG-928-G02]|nr:FumA C-terminus/TtdB family hydratase beta subunit [Eubacteriales bacterium OttesenSCG-928-G02]